jgi:Uma2 family endonuclease
MNEQVRELRSPSLSPTTQAAEGLPRRRWSVAEIEAFVASGLIDEDERFELIGGEIVPMSPKGARHERIKYELNRYWGRLVPEEFGFAIETTFRMSEDSFVEPDLVFFKTADGIEGLNPRTALLAIEVADSSLFYDLKRKARLYASFGVREVWVIEAKTLITHVHERPGIDGYAEIRPVDPATPLVPPFAPVLAVTLGALILR